MLRVPPTSSEISVAELARLAMARCPNHRALIRPGEGAITFGELGQLVDRFAAGLDALNLRPGSRLLALAAPTPEIFALALATLSTGHTLVTIDGRQDAARIRRALGEAAPDVVVGTPRVMRWWPFVGALRRARRFTAGRLGDLMAAPASSAKHVPVAPETAAIMAFSSGNTGLPKRVVRTHAVLAAQHRALRAAFPLPESDVNLPGFPLAVLHNLCCGITTVLPPVDLRSMAEADVAAVVRAIREHGVTSLSGAPAFVARLARHLISAGETVPEVQRIVIGGGPTTRRLAAEVLVAFPEADARTVYGATEAEPIATGSLREILDAGEGAAGYLAGWPVSDIEMRIEAEEAHTKFGTSTAAGEILVRGPNVIACSHDNGWHRTGDIGRIDDHGRLWLLGRVGGDVHHPFVVEERVGRLPGVAAAALVSSGLFVEIDRASDARAVVEAARSVLAAMGLSAMPIRVIDAMPMDARHQSKVDRGALR